MGSVPSELSLDFRPKFIPKTISNFLDEISLMGSVSDKVSKLDSFVKRLEEEMKKIDGFKRELPLSMLLLNDGSFFLLNQIKLGFVSFCDLCLNILFNWGFLVCCLIGSDFSFERGINAMC